jgi:hypothetical protein
MRTRAARRGAELHRLAHGLAIQQHEDRAIANRRAGTITTGLGAALDAAAGLASERNATLAFISGRRKSSGLLTFTLICTVAFWRLASGEISLMKPSYLRSGNASVVIVPCCPACSLAKSFCADIEFHFEVVQIGQRNHVALGAAVAHETGGDEFALSRLRVREWCR